MSELFLTGLLRDEYDQLILHNALAEEKVNINSTTYLLFYRNFKIPHTSYKIKVKQ